jgi:riboflavin synthase
MLSIDMSCEILCVLGFLSTTEAEHVAAVEASKVILWMCQFMRSVIAIPEVF